MEMKRLGTVGVLMGGPSSEREISLKSGKAVLENLVQAGVAALGIDITTAKAAENKRLIKSRTLGCAFIALHGRYGEDGQIQSILEELQIPYTGSGVEASKLAMDKIASLGIFAVHGLTVPRYKTFDKGSYNPHWKAHNDLGFPLVVKPATHGSSIGLSIIDDASGLERAVEEAFSFDPRVVIQQYVAGREITVGILDEKPLPVIEIVPKHRFFDFEAKYRKGLTDYIVPARLPKHLIRKAQGAALAAHKCLGCFGCSRVDIILDKDDEAFILEINTIPGFTETSLLPKAARAAGIDFTGLCVKLIELAYEKAKNKKRR
jgi:D-alanine-D-alanine ligase